MKAAVAHSNRSPRGTVPARRTKRLDSSERLEAGDRYGFPNKVVRMHGPKACQDLLVETLRDYIHSEWFHINDFPKCITRSFFNRMKQVPLANKIKPKMEPEQIRPKPLSRKEDSIKIRDEKTVGSCGMKKNFLLAEKNTGPPPSTTPLTEERKAQSKPYPGVRLKNITYTDTHSGFKPTVGKYYGKPKIACKVTTHSLARNADGTLHKTLYSQRPINYVSTNESLTDLPLSRWSQGKKKQEYWYTQLAHVGVMEFPEGKPYDEHINARIDKAVCDLSKYEKHVNFRWEHKPHESIVHRKQNPAEEIRKAIYEKFGTIKGNYRLVVKRDANGSQLYLDFILIENDGVDMDIDVSHLCKVTGISPTE